MKNCFEKGPANCPVELYYATEMKVMSSLSSHNMFHGSNSPFSFIFLFNLSGHIIDQKLQTWAMSSPIFIFTHEKVSRLYHFMYKKNEQHFWSIKYHSFFNIGWNLIISRLLSIFHVWRYSWVFFFCENLMKNKMKERKYLLCNENFINGTYSGDCDACKKATIKKSTLKNWPEL